MSLLHCPADCRPASHLPCGHNAHGDGPGPWLATRGARSRASRRRPCSRGRGSLQTLSLGGPRRSSVRLLLPSRRRAAWRARPQRALLPRPRGLHATLGCARSQELPRKRDHLAAAGRVVVYHIVNGTYRHIDSPLYVMHLQAVALRSTHTALIATPLERAMRVRTHHSHPGSRPAACQPLAGMAGVTPLE